jgi:hypothetical protein
MQPLELHCLKESDFTSLCTFLHKMDTLLRKGICCDEKTMWYWVELRSRGGGVIDEVALVRQTAEKIFAGLMFENEPTQK